MSAGSQQPRPAATTRPHQEPRAELVAGAEERYGAFIRQQVNPATQERDRQNQSFSRALMRDAVAIGLANEPLPAELGGNGRTVQEWGLLLEWVGYACDDLAFPTYLSYRINFCNLISELAQGTLGLPPRPELLAQYMAPIAAGERFASLSYTEGADPFSFKTRARRVDQGYVIRGEKTFITGGMLADWVAIFCANEHDDLMLVLIARDDAGVSFEQRDLMGMRSLGVCRMGLDEVLVPPERVLVPRDGLSFAQHYFNERRMSLSCAPVGRMQGLFDRCVEDLSGRIRYRLPTTEMQAVQARLGQLHVAIETARMVLYGSLERYTRGGYDSTWDSSIAITKYFIVQQAELVARGLSYVLGGAAYDRAQPFERAVRDFYALIHVAGTQAILETDLGLRAITEAQQRMRRARRAQALASTAMANRD